MATLPTEERIREVLASVPYPGFSRDIVSFGLVHGVAIGEDGLVTVRLELTTRNEETTQTLVAETRKALESLEGVRSAQVEVTYKSDPSRLPSAGQAGPARLLPGVGRVLAVASGKGGVGKSTVAVNLAVALARRGRRVGLLDADIYGPSIPLMFGLEGAKPETADQRALPLERFGVHMMSLGFFVDRDTAVIWRGPMVMKAVEQLLTDVSWGELDDLIIDLPPGTGDAQLTLSQKIRIQGAIIVTTPNDLALVDAVKGVTMFRRVEVPVLGIVENMSYFACPHCGERSEIFASGGARRECDRLGIPFLAELPLHPAIREGSDRGVPVVAGSPDSEQAQIFLRLAESLVTEGEQESDSDGFSFLDRFRNSS
jgi:ATP-binding protein involved in chromosome partitioning